MRLVFAHDAVLRRDPCSGHHFNEGFNLVLWARYLEVFDELTVCLRERPLRQGEAAAPEMLASGERVEVIPVPNISGPLRAITHHASALRSLEDPIAVADAVIARLPSEIGMLAIHVAQRLGKPWAVEVVGNAWDSLWNFGTWQGRAYAPIMHLRTRNAVLRAPLALYVTDQFLQRSYPNEHGRTFACSDVALVELDPQVMAARQQRALNARGPVKVGIVGSLGTRYKGVDTAIEAIQRLAPEFPGLELRVLGSGDPAPWMKIAVRHGVSERVFFDGVLPGGRAVASWMDSLDVYIQPSKTEGLPRALVEAMSRGLPALGTRVGGIPELLDRECLVDPGDSRELARLLRRLVCDEPWRLQTASRNFNRARQFHAPLLHQRRSEFLHQLRQGATNLLNAKRREETGS